MDARLKTLVIENFRSLRGRVVIPLDAQVVLVHGSNGMGKTSVLSALELGLTGRIAHLATNGDGYERYLTNIGTEGGLIEIITSSPHKLDAANNGVLRYSDKLFEPRPLLSGDDARFFSERCYLPQATLGRLLEIYNEQRTNKTSPLTLFVKELLGLDPLDALIDGLYPAFNVARIRNLVPDYRRLEGLKASLRDELIRNKQAIRTTETSIGAHREALNMQMAQLSLSAPLTLEPDTRIEDLRDRLETVRDEDRVLTDLSQKRSQLAALSERWRALPAHENERNHAEKERLDTLAADALSAWRADSGQVLEAILSELSLTFPGMFSLDDGPKKSCALAEKRAEEEVVRCNALLANSAAAAERLKIIKETIQQASVRLYELNQAIAAGAKDARSFASAIAGVASHVDGETCPVCNRDFSELESGPLVAHIAAKVASLTSEAGRLQALANEHAEESSRLTTAQREQMSAEREQLPDDEQAELMLRTTAIADIVSRLKDMVPAAEQGTFLMTEAAIAREGVTAARRIDNLSSSLTPEIHSIVLQVTGRPSSSFESIDLALSDAMKAVADQIAAVEALVTLRVTALSELELYAKDQRDLADLESEKVELTLDFQRADDAVGRVDVVREQAKMLSDTSEKLRSAIVRKVFNTSLNKVWRDLFVRLSPSEQFVPTFRLPVGEGGKVEAVLETLHRSGMASGSPGAMLSQGNLNTAALTLFLSLHLSVPARMPWLVLDDPVQSMDDVHIAQFAALLRTLSKGMGRQIIVAVHERALFDYLTLELSPSFVGDSLITAEITRNFNGDTVVTPQAYHYEEDRAIAV
jgi:exonuclease SbcC